MSEISEFRDEMREALGQINRRFDSVGQRLDSVDQRLDSVDQRLDSMDKRMDSLEKEIVDNTQAICDLIYENDKKYCKRLDNVESICKERWIAPDLQIRLEVVEKVVIKHTDQINTLPCAQ